MARIKSKRMAVSTISCKFGGMGKYAPLSSVGAEDMCNFRLLPNGTLKVRSGYARKKHFASQGKVRGIWEGTLSGSSYLFAVVGNTVYRLVDDAMTETSVGTIADGTENVQFFVYEDVLYLLDGENIWNYRSSSNKFEVIEPYVPLYGYLWDPSSYGEVNEEINLLTPKIRVLYHNPNGETEFKLPYYATRIDVAFLNGKKTTNFNFSPGTDKIVFPTAPLSVEVSFIASLNEEARTAIRASQIAYIYSRGGANQLFLGGKDARLFYTKSVSGPMLSSCQALYPTAVPLYFVMEDIFFLGDNAHPITAICPLYETLLAFTSDRIWSIAFEKEGIQATLAMYGIGCASRRGAIPYETGVLAALGDGIYHITASPTRPEEIVTERISKGIDEKFSAKFGERVHLVRNTTDGEIWMRDPTNTAGEIWIWNFEQDEWYRFSGITASFFFQNNTGIGFASGSDICVFERSKTTDSGSPIDAYYKSAYLDFGVPDSVRRSLRAFLYASPSKSDCEVLFETEQKEQSYQLSTPMFASTPQLHDMRISTHRYRFLRFTLSTSASHQTEFYRLDVYSGP